MTKDLRETIYNLETSLLKLEVRQSATDLDLLLADDFIEFGSSGEIYNKKQILERLPQESKNSPVEFSVRDFEVKEIVHDIVLATFRTDKILSNKKTITALRASIWKKFDDQWTILFHQGTLVK